MAADVGAEHLPALQHREDRRRRLPHHAGGGRLRRGRADVEVRDGQLIVTGRKAEDEEKGNFLHRGIAARAFERRFQLADHVRADARRPNGLLHIDLVREVPEALKPRRIEIGGAKAIESQASA